VEKEEKMELRHEQSPGYRPVFYIVLALAIGYLGIIFFVV